MTLGESDAVQQPGRRKQRPPEPEIPEETEPDPAIDPMPEEELEGLAGEILSLLQRQRVMHMDQIGSGAGGFHGGTDHNADGTGTIRETGTPAGKTIPADALVRRKTCGNTE